MSSRYVDSLFRAVSVPASRLDLHSLLASLAAATAGSDVATSLDHLYARIGALNGPFFPCGWGNLSVVNYEEDIRHLIQTPPASIKLSWRLVERGNRDGQDYMLYEGTFRTPCLQRVYDALPPESRTGRVQLLMPARLQPLRVDDTSPPSPPPREAGLAAGLGRLPYPYGGSRRLEQETPSGTAVRDGPACVIHLAATGDQTFGRRLNLGFPLLKDNVCSMVLESPFYGARRPEAQRGSKLLRVSDLLTLGWATIAESINLLHWLREEGYGALGMCGLSMGGVHACMTAGLFPGDVAVTPLLAPRSAAVAYCDGAMRAVMAWEPLLKEVDENNNHITQVLRDAGRPVTVQVPTAVHAHAHGPPGGTPPFQSVALIREATYALADLEVTAERQHLAGGVQGGPGAGADATAGAGTGVGAGLLGGLPSVSLLDVYGRLADVALRVGLVRDGGSRSRGDSVASSSMEQGGLNYGRKQLQGEPQRASSAAEVSQTDEAQSPTPAGGPVSGATASSDVAADGGAQHQHQSQQQHQQRHPPPNSASHHVIRGLGSAGPCKPRDASAAGPPESPRAWQHTEPRVARPHPQPHTADTTFHRPHAAGPTSAQVTNGSSSVAVTGTATQGSTAVTASIGNSFGGTNGSCSGTGAAAVPSGSGGGGSEGGATLGQGLLGDFGRAVRLLRAGDRRLDDPVTVLRLKNVLETYTDITRYPRPRRTDAAVIVAARDDAYVSTESVQQLHRYWPGSELRMVSGGHVSAFLMHQDAFRGAIRDSLNRLARPPRHPQPPGHSQ